MEKSRADWCQSVGQTDTAREESRQGNTIPRQAHEFTYPSGPAVGVEDEERDVGELEQGAGAVDGGDEGPAAVGDPREAVPEADAAVEQGQQVGQPIELLCRLGLEDPLERRPGGGAAAAGAGHSSAVHPLGSTRIIRN